MFFKEEAFEIIKINGKNRVIKPRFYFYLFVAILLLTATVLVLTGFYTIDNTKPVVFANEENVLEPRYGFTDNDIYLLAQLLCGDRSVDGDGEYDIDFQQEINYYEVGKVLGIVMNRVRSDQFPNSVKDVVLQEGQFSVMPRNLNVIPSEVALLTVHEWCIAYDNHINLVQVIPIEHLYFTGNGFINITS